MNHPDHFSTLLLDWHQTIDRYLPWKEDNNVFYIWLSEIILQQTRVEQGIPYFLKFKARFKNVHELAAISDQELMKLWEGLGYYTRARNLHQAAKQVVADGGVFPKTYEGLLKLKGIGPYTAAAIASFAYNIPVPVLDGNVNRVVTRIFGITEAIDSKEGHFIVKDRLGKIFDTEKPAAFNQAIMDFGAMVCTPKSPKCSACSFQNHCVAFQNDMISHIPYKAKKVKKKSRTLHYLILEEGGRLLLRKRTSKDIWRHLHEFVLIEQDTINSSTIESVLKKIGTYDHFLLKKATGPHKHVLTHQNLSIYFHHISLNQLNVQKGSEYFLVERENLRKFAFPKIIDWYLDQK